MLTLEQIIEKLNITSLKKVAHGTGISYQQIWRIKAGIDKNPQYKTMQALDYYFFELDYLKIGLCKTDLKTIIDSRIHEIIDGLSVDELQGNAIKAIAYKLSQAV